MTQMKLWRKQKQASRHTEEIRGCQGGGGCGRRVTGCLEFANAALQTIMYKNGYTARSDCTAPGTILTAS